MTPWNATYTGSNSSSSSPNDVRVIHFISEGVQAYQFITSKFWNCVFK